MADDASGTLAQHEVGSSKSVAAERSVGPILVVDDDPGIRLTIAWALEDAGCVVETASDGIQAVERAAAMRPALIVLDLRLPGADAPIIADRMRNEHGISAPILLITADHRAAQAAREMGAFAYLTKPFEIDDLLDTVRRGLDESR